MYKLIIGVLFSLCASDAVVTFIASPRVLLVLLILLWLRYERNVECMRAGVVEQSMRKIVEDNHAMSRAIMNLSDQHQIMCEIRNNVLRTLRYSKDVLGEIASSRSPVSFDDYAVRGRRFKERSMSESVIH